MENNQPNNNEELTSEVGKPNKLEELADKLEAAKEVTETKEEETEELEQREFNDTNLLDPVISFKKIEMLGKDGKERDIEELMDELSDGIAFPVNRYKKEATYTNLIDMLTSGDNSEYLNTLSNSERLTTILNADAWRKSNRNDALFSNINAKDKEYRNFIEFGEKKLNTRPLTLSDNKNISQATALAKFSSFLGVGALVQVPLWHSGFWVTIRPIKQTDFINLHIELNENTIRLGRDTTGLIYSNYGVIFNRIVTDFIINNITESTLDMSTAEDNKTIRDYISMHDLYPLVNGLLAAIYPKGIDVKRSCINSIELDSDGKPLCDYIAEAKVDSKKLLWVNRAALTNDQLAHMAKRNPKSVTVDQVLEYQNQLGMRKTKEINLTGEDGQQVILQISIPTLEEHITQGERWVDSIITYTESLYRDKDNDRDKSNKIIDVLLSAKMNLFNSFVKGVKTVNEDGEESDLITGNEVLKEFLDVMSGEVGLHKQLTDEIDKFVNESAIAVVATPSYTCPKCKADQSKDNTNKVFKEFLPLNVIESFFDLCNLRVAKLRARGLY